MTLEPLEVRTVLAATGLPGNACAPDLDLSAIETQSIRPGEELVIDLLSAGGTVVDLDANENPTGDTIRFQLDPDDTPEGATITDEGIFSWTPGIDQTGTFEIVVLAVDEGDPPLADAEVFLVEVVPNAAPDLQAISDREASVGEMLEVTITATDDGDNLTFVLDRDDPQSTLPDDAELEQLNNNTAVIRWTPDETELGETFEFSVLVTDDGFPPRGDRESFLVTVTSLSANDDEYDVAVDGELNVNEENGVLANDVDSNGDPLTASVITDPTNGSLTLEEDGSFTYMPNSEFHGTDTFTYEADDGNGDTSEATVTILVNSAPSTVINEYFIDEDMMLSVNAESGVLDNDNDPDDDTLTATLVNDVSSGTLSLQSDGSFTYMPDENFNGTDTFTYRANDGFVDSVETTVTIMVAAVNDAPVAVADDQYSVDEDMMLDVNEASGVLANDSDAEGDTLTVSLVNDVSSGTLSLQSDGSFTYMPNENFNGTDMFIYVANDGDLDSEETTVTITINAVNDAPVAVDDEEYSVDEDMMLDVNEALGVLANDSDTEGDPLTATLVNDVSNGTLTLESDGSFTYMPDADFFGTDSFTYVANDGDLDSEETTVTITVNAINDAPQGVDDEYTATEDMLLEIVAIDGVLANDVDAEDDALTAVLDDGVSDGILMFEDDGSFTYMPDADFSGEDSFTYTVTDGVETSDPVMVTITVVDQNAFSVAENSPAGTSVGTLTPETDLGTPVVYSVDDPNLDPLLELAADDHMEGNPAGSVVLIEYLDLQCPFCRTYHPIVEQLLDDFPDLLVVRRHFPLENNHPNAFAAAIAAEAAGKQGVFDEYVDLLYDNQDEWADESDPQPFFEDYADDLGLDLNKFVEDQADTDLTDRVQRDLDAITTLQGPGTPTFFLQGDQIDNPDTLQDFETLIQSSLDAVDETFALNRLTGEITVRDPAELDFETNPSFSLSIIAVSLQFNETIDALIHVTDVEE